VTFYLFPAMRRAGVDIPSSKIQNQGMHIERVGIVRAKQLLLERIIHSTWVLGKLAILTPHQCVLFKKHGQTPG
jgi:hypothetical protein